MVYVDVIGSKLGSLVSSPHNSLGFVVSVPAGLTNHSSWNVTLTLFLSKGPVTSVQQTKDGNALLISTLDSTIRLIDKGNGKLLQSYTEHKNTDYRIRSRLALSDSTVISGSEDGSIFAWNLLDRSVTERLVGAHGQKVVSAVDYNSGSGRVGQWASAGGDGTCKISFSPIIVPCAGHITLSPYLHAAFEPLPLSITPPNILLGRSGREGKRTMGFFKVPSPAVPPP